MENRWTDLLGLWCEPLQKDQIRRKSVQSVLSFREEGFTLRCAVEIPFEIFCQDPIDDVLEDFNEWIINCPHQQRWNFMERRCLDFPLEETKDVDWWHCFKNTFGCC